MNSCRMTTSGSCRMSGRLAGGADIEEVEAKVEDLESPSNDVDTEKHASISKKQPSISEIPKPDVEKHTSIVSEKQPSVASEKQPSIVSEKQSSIVSEKQPSIVSEKHTSIVSEKQPSIAGEKHTSIVSQKQPSIVSEKHTSIVSEKQPSIVSEKHTSIVSEKQPSIVSEKQPSIVSEKHASIVSEKSVSSDKKHGSVSEKSVSGQSSVRISEQKSVDYTQQKKASSVSQLSKTSKAAADDCGDDYLIPPTGPCCVCLSSPTTGDRTVDELIEYVRHNLQEANKVLASLPDNFEQELKLLYADVLARVKKWIAMVQSKLATIDNDIETLRKQLIARMCELAKKDREIADLKAKLAECMAAREALEKALAEKTAEVEAERAKRPSQVERRTETASFVRTSTGPEMTAAREEPLRPSQVQAMANATVQCTGRDKERLKREAELEAELARLRKENERIVKERAEYEAAIQRALLRGVSCLNVEALRVLRCPPIPCCSPCAPCPASKNGRENTVPCDAKTREKIAKTCGQARRTCPAKNGHDQGSSVTKRPCTSPCCTGRYSRQKSRGENDMVFVLHQGDVGNICEPDMPRVCGRVKKIDISPCSRESSVSCDAGSAGRNLSQEKVCDSTRYRANNNGQRNEYDQCNGLRKLPSDVCFPRVSSREFIDDLVLSFCGTADTDTPPVCGEPIMKRVEIPPCPKFRF